MLPQLKWRNLKDADINQIPFVAKKRTLKCDYRGFGGLGGRNVAVFSNIYKMMLNILGCEFLGPQHYCG